MDIQEHILYLINIVLELNFDALSNCGPIWHLNVFKTF